jgi:hypothetical protein
MPAAVRRALKVNFATVGPDGPGPYRQAQAEEDRGRVPLVFSARRFRGPRSHHQPLRSGGSRTGPSAIRKLSRWAGVLRLFTGAPVPEINRRTGINHENEASGTGAPHGTTPGHAGSVAPDQDSLIAPRDLRDTPWYRPCRVHGCLAAAGLTIEPWTISTTSSAWSADERCGDAGNTRAAP